MANLTGDFDVIAQFAVPAVNRVLAAMHRIERFPHSMSMRVDDTPQPTHGWRPSVIGVVDVFGDPTADHSSIRDPQLIHISDFPVESANGRLAAALDAIANLDISLLDIPPIEPSNIKGKAQVQVFPPTIELSTTNDRNITVRLDMMSRYLPDPGTAPVSEFVRGDLRITASVNQVVSQVGNVISIDVKASSAAISFTPAWSSTPLSAADLAGINQLVRNALKTSFLPSNATLPSNIGHIQFKTISASPGAVAVLLDMDGAAGNPATASQSFLANADGFAFGIGADYLRAQFQPTLDSILSQQLDPVKFKIDSPFHTWHITYTVTLNSAALDIQNGKLVLIVKGHAHTGTSWLPDFDWTFKQDITLEVDGSTAMLAFGSMSLDTSSTIVDIFKSRAMSNLSRVRDRALLQSNAQTRIRKMLSAEENLGGFLKSLLTPGRLSQTATPLEFALEYTSAEIRQSGIILHGSVSTPLAPPPRVEYQPITPAPGSITIPGDAVVSGPDYTALKSWIPGGTVDRYEWHRQGSQGYSDSNRFVLLDQGPVSTMAMSNAVTVAGYSPMCLTVHGKRLTTSGPVTPENVSATMCGYRSFPLGDFAIAGADIGPVIALVRGGPSGMVEVLGHAPAMSKSDDTHAPNLIVHFADEVSGEKLEGLTNALRASQRGDAPTAIVVAAKASRISRLPYSEGVTYAEDNASWRRMVGLPASGAFTVVIDPSGKVAWKAEGPVNERELSLALGKVLVKAAPPRATLLSAGARIGHPAPNFLFEHSRGQPLTLRKTGGRKVSIVFFSTASEPSVNAVRDTAAAAGEKAIVLAVSDRGAQSSEDLSPAIVVPDRDGKIAAAYGVTMWPTIVSIDEAGIVRSITYGRSARAEAKQRA